MIEHAADHVQPALTQKDGNSFDVASPNVLQTLRKNRRLEKIRGDVYDGTQHTLERRKSIDVSAILRPYPSSFTNSVIRLPPNKDRVIESAGRLSEPEPEPEPASTNHRDTADMANLLLMNPTFRESPRLTSLHHSPEGGHMSHAAAGAANESTYNRMFKHDGQHQRDNVSHVPTQDADFVQSNSVLDVSGHGSGGEDHGGNGHPMNSSGGANNSTSESDPLVLFRHHDVIMRRWKLQAFLQMHLHHDSHYFYRNVYNILSVPLIVLTTASSITIFSSSHTFIRYVVASMTICATILAGLVWQFQPAEKSQQHAMLAQRYRILLHSLESVMKTPPCMRQDVNSFMKSTQEEMDVLIVSQVDPPSLILTRHRKIFGSMNAILYGDDVVAALMNNIKTSNMVSMINERSKSIPKKWSKQAATFFEKMMMDSNDPEIARRGGLRSLILPVTLEEEKKRMEALKVKHGEEQENDIEMANRFPFR